MLDYKLIIFDWDGTLMDSVNKIVTSMQKTALSAQLVVPSAHEVQQIIGLSLPVAIAKLFPDISQKQCLLLTQEYKRQYAVNTTPTPLFDGATELLSALQNENKLLAIATGKGRSGLQGVLDATQTQMYFHASRTSDDAKSKPHPEMLNSLLDELNVAKEDAVMIGDTSHHLAMAQSAGIDSVGVTFGVHCCDVLKAFEPKAIVDSFSELQELLIYPSHFKMIVSGPLNNS